jgi:hypothetical protein
MTPPERVDNNILQDWLQQAHVEHYLCEQGEGLRLDYLFPAAEGKPAPSSRSLH